MKQQFKNIQRLSNFEILRIFSMFLIVLSHFLLHTQNTYIVNNGLNDKINNVATLFLLYSGKVGVNIFIILSGYFSVQKNKLLYKIPNIYLQTLFYSLSIYLLWIFCDKDIQKNHIYYSYFPLTNNTYWFITSYILMYTFSPLLNILLNNTNPILLKKYFIYITLLISVIPSYTKKFLFPPVYIYFLLLYMIGGAIKLNIIKLNTKALIYLAIAIAIFYLYTYLPYLLDENANLRLMYKTPQQYSFGALVVSIIIFNIFSKIKIQHHFINYIASSMLGVYLIHDNIFLRPYIWNNLLNAKQYFNTPLFLFYAITISAFVLIICTIIDKLLSKAYLPFIKYILRKIPQKNKTCK